MNHTQIHGRPPLAHRLDEIGWGLLLLLTGVIWLLPERGVPHGVWLLGAGVILLGMTAVRYLNKIPVSLFTIILGIIAFAAGLSAMAGVSLPLFSLFLIVAGAAIVLRPLIGEPRVP